MNIGLPGTGIGGLFYLLAALSMPIFEIVRTLRGRSSWQRWRLVFRQTGLAAGVISALWLTSWTIRHGLPNNSSSALHSVSAQVGRAAGVTPTFWTYGTLAAVLIAVEIGWIFMGRRTVQTDPV